MKHSIIVVAVMSCLAMGCIQTGLQGWSSASECEVRRVVAHNELHIRAKSNLHNWIQVSPPKGEPVLGLEKWSRRDWGRHHHMSVFLKTRDGIVVILSSVGYEVNNETVMYSESLREVHLSSEYGKYLHETLEAIQKGGDPSSLQGLSTATGKTVLHIPRGEQHVTYRLTTTKLLNADGPKRNNPFVKIYNDAVRLNSCAAGEACGGIQNAVKDVKVTLKTQFRTSLRPRDLHNQPGSGLQRTIKELFGDGVR